MARIQVSDVEFHSHRGEIAQVEKAVVLAWLDSIGQDAAETAAKYAPVDTGRLKNSISNATQPDEMAAYIGTNVPYAIYQELGTSRIAGKHYLQFGATAHANEYGKLLEKLMKQ